MTPTEGPHGRHPSVWCVECGTENPVTNEKTVVCLGCKHEIRLRVLNEVPLGTVQPHIRII